MAMVMAFASAAVTAWAASDEASEPSSRPASSPVAWLDEVGHTDLSKALGEARRTIQVIDGVRRTLPKNLNALYFAYNPAQHLSARFISDGGVRVESARADRDWTLSLHTIPNPNNQQARISTAGTRVEIAHSDEMLEWYENRHLGIKHGYTIYS